jgi:hypothetical protein
MIKIVNSKSKYAFYLVLNYYELGHHLNRKKYEGCEFLFLKIWLIFIKFSNNFLHRSTVHYLIGGQC